MINQKNKRTNRWAVHTGTILFIVCVIVSMFVNFVPVRMSFSRGLEISPTIPARRVSERQGLDLTMSTCANAASEVSVWGWPATAHTVTGGFCGSDGDDVIYVGGIIFNTFVVFATVYLGWFAVRSLKKVRQP